jgi:hypothetical protein
MWADEQEEEDEKRPLYETVIAEKKDEISTEALPAPWDLGRRPLGAGKKRRS